MPLEILVHLFSNSHVPHLDDLVLARRGKQVRISRQGASQDFIAVGAKVLVELLPEHEDLFLLGHEIPL